MKKTFSALALCLASSALWAQSPTEQNYSDGLPIMAGMSVTFADNSSVFSPTREQMVLLTDALNAKLVIVKGRTSTAVASPKDEALALARAVSARNWLINFGVSPLKIYLNYLSAGDHLEDNSTKEGRALNQRVDIEAYFVDLNQP